MTRQRWLKSGFSCELKPSRHLANRIVFCNDCLSNRTLWVSASGTLDCSVCGSQNWMHHAVPLANRASVAAKAVSPARDVETSLACAALAAAPVRHPDGELGKERSRVTLKSIATAATYLTGWVDSCGRATVQSIHEIFGQLRVPLRCSLLRLQQVLWAWLCCIRSWLAPAKQA